MADQDFISGALAGQEFSLNQQKQQMNRFLIEEAPVKLEQEKLAVKIGQQDFANRQKFAEKLAAMPPPPPGQDPMQNAADTFLGIAHAAAEAKMPEQSMEAFSKGATIQYQQEEAAYRRLQMINERAKAGEELLSGAHDEKSFEEAKRTYQAIYGDHTLDQLKWSPDIVETIRKGITEKRTAAQEALTRAQAAREVTQGKADEALVKQREALAALYEQRKNAAAKVGGDGLIANSKTVSAVADYLVRDSGDVMTPVDARVYARDIALDAERRMQKDKLDLPSATAAAVKYAKDHGMLAGIRPSPKFAGSDPSKPLPLPQNPGDAKAYKPNMWYQTQDGPRWYDPETQSLYKAGEGPEDSEDTEK